jgi:pyruvate,water dikinase
LDKTADDPRPLVTQRQAETARFQKLAPPRIITSDGEMPTAQHSRANIPDGALAGSAVSAGVVEGIARVVLDPTKETLNPGEILVAPFTDPGWTPLFINAAGLVMEVGGLMTHGSVVAREYGIPAVVSVTDATTRIQTGQTLRVHGDGGYVEILN